MTHWELRKISVEDREWEILIAKHPHLLFHEPIWARVTESGLHSETCCLVLEKKGEVAGGMLGFIKHMIWAKFLYLSLPYGGIIGEIPDEVTFAKLLYDFSKNEKITRVRITDAPLLTPTSQRRFQVIEGQTHMLKIKGTTSDKIWTEFKSRVRRDVRKAIRSGVVVDSLKNHANRDEFFSLYLESMRRNNAVPKYAKQYVNAIFEYIIKTGKGDLLLARLENKAIAGILLVYSQNISHYLMGGSCSDMLKYCPNDLLIFEAINRSFDKGFEYFDFLPSGIHDQALVRFKKKWGAEPFQLNTLDMVIQPSLMKLWNMAYQIAETKPARQLLQWYQSRKKSE